MKRILVVEDEEHLAIGIKYNLEAEGYDVCTAGDGKAALDLLAEESQAIDLVILDLMLPGMSGYAVCESLRQEEILRRPVDISHARVSNRMERVQPTEPSLLLPGPPPGLNSTL